MKIFDGLKRVFSSGTTWFLKRSLITKVILIAVVALGAWFGLRPIIVGNNQSQIQYQTAQAEKGTLITSITGTGTISAGNGANITSSATGVVKEVNVQNGDYVHQGDPIATLALDQASLQKQTAAWANYLAAQNALNAAKSKMDSLQAALFEANQTFTKDAGTVNPTPDDPQYIIQRAKWLQAEADYTQQGNVIRQAEIALSSAWLSYAQTSAIITAPMSGTVASLTLSPGVSIAGSSSTSTSNSSSQTFGSIVLDQSLPQATINLSEIDITKVNLGQKVNMKLDAFPNKTFTGRVSAINTTGTTSSGVTSYPVTIAFDTNVDKMYPNMAVSATIITNIKNDVLLVPSSAVQTTNGQSTVQVMRNGQPTDVDVEVGDSNDTQTQIISGLKEGDTVITGQTTDRATSTNGQNASSPFGGTGFGGRGIGGRAGGQFFIQR